MQTEKITPKERQKTYRNEKSKKKQFKWGWGTFDADGRKSRKGKHDTADVGAKDVDTIYEDTLNIIQLERKFEGDDYDGARTTSKFSRKHHDDDIFGLLKMKRKFMMLGD